MQDQATTTNGEKLLTKLDVARLAQYSLRSVNYWISTGALPYVKFGRGVRFLAAAVEKFIQSHRVGGK
jgi:excisionase family DNA binding protein